MIDCRDGVVFMDLMDLEHCGFSVDDFQFELSTVRKDAEKFFWPDVLVINFAGGAVVWSDTSDEALQRQAEAYARFLDIVRPIWERDETT